MSAGALTAQCVGVSKTAVCKLIQRDDVTFTLSVRPQETGRHMLTIKFNNEHVPGDHVIIVIIIILFANVEHRQQQVRVAIVAGQQGSELH